MAFRKYGGLNYAATNNIIRNHYANSDNFFVSNVVGQYNSKIVSESHYDMSGNSLLNVEAIYFMDGSSLTGGTENGNFTVNGNLTVTGTSTLRGTVTTSADATIGADLTVQGTSILQDLVTIGSDSTSTNLLVTGASNLSGNVKVGGNLKVDGTNSIVDLGSGPAYAPTPKDTNSNEIATTSFLTTNYAPLNSPSFSGAPTAPTPSSRTSNTQIATTEFVQSAVTTATSGWKFIKYTQATLKDQRTENFDTGYSSSKCTVIIAGWVYNMKNYKDAGTYQVGVNTYISETTGTWWVSAETYNTTNSQTAVWDQINCLVIPYASEIILL
uniref:Uncharacterized protein n=1 Tax=viral metagenome TaxID=1070528 RepID=A0A6C0BC11_9ZZZZ